MQDLIKYGLTEGQKDSRVFRLHSASPKVVAKATSAIRTYLQLGHGYMASRNSATLALADPGTVFGGAKRRDRRRRRGCRR